MLLRQFSVVVTILCFANQLAANESADQPALLRIALVGDSTVASYPEPPTDRPSLTGWGQVFEEFFNDRVMVLNHAVSGRSSKSFISEGLWQKTLEAKPDYVLVQFGHNDQPGKGERSTDASTDYQDFLRQYIKDTRAIGATPVLVTPVARRTFEEGRPQSTLQPYADAMKKVGQEQNVPVIDLHGASLTLLAELGDAGSADLSPSPDDRSHFSRKGARTMARLVAEALPQAVPALQPYLTDIWFDNRVGIADVVPAPWTPLVVDGSTVKPWGRTYVFDRSLLPTEVVTRDASVLAAPIAIRGRANGKPLALSGEPNQITVSTPTMVSLTGCATADGLTLTGKTTVEYDGMVRVDVAVAADGEEPVTVEELLLEIPVRPEHARYLYHFPGQWGSVANSGYLPADGWTHAFKPFVWLGDEDRGLAWFCESDENWSPADANRALTIARDKDRVVLCCHLIERPTVLAGPLKYTFGFQATPVKCPAKTVWDYRITHSGNYGLERQPAQGPNAPTVQWLASRGVRTICFHEHWSPYQSHPYVTDENRPKLKSLVEGCHQHGISLLLYMSRQLADNAPEWARYSQEVVVLPHWGVYQRQPPQKAYGVCWRSVWKDFCLFHLDRLLAEFGHDGWYLDGSEWPMACTNQLHGCGYRAADGTVHPTYDIFATRDFMKRLYVLTRQRRPDAQLNIHNSTVMVIPTLGFGTSSWGGEQIDAIKPPVKALDILPMDAFRTEFMGRQWGVPSEFLVYDGQPYYAKDVLAYTLLHGVLIRPSGPEDLDRIAALWKVYDEFPFQDAKLYPYWNNAELLTCAPAGVYVTAYERPGDGLLMFVSNLADDDTDATVTLHSERLGWNGISTVWDAVTHETIANDNGRICVPLASWRYRVIRVQPGSAPDDTTPGMPPLPLPAR